VTESGVVPGVLRGGTEIVNSRHREGESGAVAHLALIDMYRVVAVLVELETTMNHVIAIEIGTGSEIEIVIETATETGIGMATVAEAEDTTTVLRLWKSIATSRAPVLDLTSLIDPEDVNEAVVAREIETEIGARGVEIAIARGIGSGGTGVEIGSGRGRERRIRTRTRLKRLRVAGARA